jgi:DNA mismatch repair protein MutS
LEERNVGIKNYHITTQETKKNVIFLRKMKRGGSDRSFGIHVAQMAGIPKSILKRAEHILNQLEKDRSSIDNSKKMKNIPSAVQLSLFEISDPEMKEVMHLLEQIDVNRLTPVEALLKINELKSVLK